MKLDAEKNAARYPRAERAAKSVRMHRGGRQRKNHSGRLCQILAGFGVDRGSPAQVCPVDIRAQIFAAHGAVCGALDGRTVIGWNTTARQPVVNNLRPNPNRFGELGLCFENRNCLVESVHTPRLNTWGILVNIWCLRH